LKVLGALVFLFILSPRTGLAVLLVFPCYAFLLYRYRSSHYAVSRQISETNARNQRKFASSIGSIELVKTNAAENRVSGAIRTGFARIKRAWSGCLREKFSANSFALKELQNNSATQNKHSKIKEYRSDFCF